MEQGEIEASPDVVYLDEDESEESEYDSRRVVKNPSLQEIEVEEEEEEEEEVDDDIGPTIKPPQARSKREKHKHKSRREKKRSVEKSRDRHSHGSRRSDPDRRKIYRPVPLRPPPHDSKFRTFSSFSLPV